MAPSMAGYLRYKIIKLIDLNARIIGLVFQMDPITLANIPIGK